MNAPKKMTHVFFVLRYYPNHSIPFFCTTIQPKYQKLILSPEMSSTRTPLAKCIGLKKPLEGWMAWRRIKADNCREEPCSIALTFNLTDASKVDTHSKGNDEFQFLSFKR